MGKINKVRVNLGALDELLEEFSKNVTIKVGIIGNKAAQKHEGSDLTNAELGAVHEFGATINATNKMRGYFYHKFGINKSSEPIIIPTRSFLRMPLIGADARKEIIKKVIESIGQDEALVEFLNTKPSKNEMDNAWREEVKSVIPKDLMVGLAEVIGQAALERVWEAIETDGFEKWIPTTEFTREHRKGSAGNPSLEDTGELKKAISFEVIKN